LQDSYQVESTVKLSDVTDQSVMLVKLPLADGMSEDLNIPLKNYLKDRESFIHDLFEANFNDIEAIVKYFEDRGVSYLGSKEIVFHCPCSQEQMVTSLKGLSGSDINELYKEDKSIEINCDYCGKQYKVTREDIEF
jgi:molecular chaperone Hsp33